MFRLLKVLSLCIITTFFFISLALAIPLEKDAPFQKVFIFGKVIDTHKEPVAQAKIKIFINGQPYQAKTHQSKEALLTEKDGSFYLVLDIPDEVFHKSNISLLIEKSTYKKTKIFFTPSDFAQKDNKYFVQKEIILKRTLNPAFWIATVVFLLAYILISFELLHRTLAAMLGAAIMLAISYTIGTFNPDYHIISYESAIKAIDMNVIFLLMGMMIIIGVLKNTGVFQWCAYKCYQISRGNVILLSIIFMIFTAVTSAFLDNVTTMLLLTPVTIEIALALKINPLSLLIPEILASNVGGTATLIGDPPNIMIGSYAKLTFLQFVENLAPVCIMSLFMLFVYSRFIFKEEYSKSKIENIEAFLEKLRQEYQITDKTLLTFGLLIMGIVILMFVLHGVLHMEVSIAALFGASILFAYSAITKKVDIAHLVEKDIEWLTLLFFMFLFILVGAVESVGLLDIVADSVLHLSHDNLIVAISLILWVSAIMSAFIDNIPFTATMLPIVAYLTKVIPGAESGVLWWALAFGACFGGNGTAIGASANVVTLGIAEAAGYRMTFFDFMKKAGPYTILTIILANIWLLLFF
ncbi:ArsB/NhaD family transporter [Thermodesulfatator autotrophicus]|uniref:Citrate transporter n=1 Tax=Thermodesulfatator autotrophicus TaxID=1795632 RepID=A0A177E952_9BACT|nr:ArsB/NhaD family transporter [Thermodesulfatator autotrophicus]OAG27742.1 citrate transporter [Thermodesulfatator autotrophicus]